MALVKGATFRLVGVVDVGAVIEEPASSTADDITEFCLEVIGQHGDKDVAAAVARAILDMTWIDVELEPEDDGERDLLAENLAGDDE